MKLFHKLFLASLILIGLIIRFYPVSVQSTPDESHYKVYAQAIQQKGLEGWKEGIANFNLRPEYWSYPSPLFRLAYLSAVTLTSIGKPIEIKNGILFAKIISFLNLGLILLFAYKFFNKKYIWIFLLLGLAYPTELGISLHMWQDGFLAFLTGLIIFLSSEKLIQEKNRKLSRILYFTIGVTLFFTKEFAPLILLSSWLAFTITEAITKKQITQSLRLWARFTWIIIGVLCLYRLLLGSYQPIYDFFDLRLKNPVNHLQTNLSYLDVTQEFIQGLFWTSPVLLVLFSTNILAFTIKTKGHFYAKENPLSLYLSLFVLIYTAGIILMLDHLNLRLLHATFIPYVMASGSLLLNTLESIRESLKNKLTAISLSLLILFCAGDYLNFKRIYVTHNAPDAMNPFIKELSIYHHPNHNCQTDPRCIRFNALKKNL